MDYSKRYEELQGKYKISRFLKWDNKEEQYKEVNPDDYDVVYEFAGTGYAHKKFYIHKNAPKLSNEDLAIICSRGDLPWGYRIEGNYVVVHTD